MTAVAFQASWGLSGSAAQDSASSYQTFTYDVVYVDTHGFHTGSGIITIPVTGVYLLHADWSGSGNTERTIQIRKNGTSIRGNTMGGSSGGDSFTSVAHWVGCLTAGDQIDVRGSSTLTIADTFGWLRIMRIPLPFVHGTQSGDITGASSIGYTETSDIEGWHDPGDPTKFTVDETGDYILSVTGRSVGGALLIQVYVNGTGLNHYASGVGFDRDPHIHTLLHLTAGDYVQIRNDSSCVALDRDGSANHFAMWRLPAGGAYVGTRDDSNTTTSAGGTKMPMALEDADTDGFHDNVTNNTRLTVPSGKAGTYLVWAGFYMNYGVVLNGGIWKNNRVLGDYIELGDYNMMRGGAGSPNTLAVMDLVAGDYIELNVYTGNTGQTASAVRLGMVRLDDLTYVTQICPGDPVTFVPQIVRYR